ncbi:MAG: IclR family transcriptional regulator [Alphaproteobacteria bacterium]|nr:IclR family transcriptional regulator [Alphaproteobacteria bacterium]
MRTGRVRAVDEQRSPHQAARIDATVASKPRSKSADARYSVQSLQLGLRLLEALANGKERGVTELANELGVTKWRIFRHAHSLCEEGFATQDPTTGKFQLGRRTYALLEALPNRFNFAHETRPEMSALRDERGHAVTVAVPADDRSVVIVDAIEGVHAVQFNLRIGAMFDLHASAHGKATLAFGPSDWLEHVIARGLRRHTDYTITDPRTLRRAVERVRIQGWSTAPEEAFRGVNTVVAPIFSASRNFVGTIGLFGSIDDIPRNPDRKDVKAVMAAARRISQKLGWK